MMTWLKVNKYMYSHTTIVLFGSQVFSIRWQGLRIMKHKMDSCPQIDYVIKQICANLKNAVRVSAHFHTYQLISAISKKNM